MKPVSILLAVGGAGLLGVGGWWFGVERRWQGDLYCIQRPGTVWNGLAPLPGGLTLGLFVLERLQYRMRLRGSSPHV
ncbi:hypothetical protein F8S09_15335 [Deinococcus sp. SDU3-2]|uniref:Uncharacterized protein n=1 Tax=Deinococcus terrestris TaxID=2651870 RepID=A0A7X1NYV3_9DEIO|nr:hypothetical protein [Deinococcus terrestris]MPY68029.1 hypothetical protein [Deinococcus terrestris]